MENNIKINRDGYGYYIVINNDYIDNDIINYLGITGEFYFEKGKEFNGNNMEEGALYFHYKKDANKFKKWLEKYIDGFLIAKKLVE